MFKIAVLTCSEINENTTVDDDLCWNILKKRNIDIVEVIWDEEHDYSVYDLVLIRTTWDYQYKKELFAKKIQQISTQARLVNPANIVLWNMNKKYLVEFQEKGLPVIPSIYRENINAQEIEKLLSQKEFQEGIIIKPCVGGSSFGIQLIKSLNDFEQVKEGQWLIQPYLPDISSRGETSLIFFNGKFSHAIIKEPKAGEFRSQEEYGSKIYSVKPSEEQFKIANRVLDSLENVLPYARVDLIPNKDSFMLVELELIEPCLFLHYEPEIAPQNMANMVIDLLNN